MENLSQTPSQTVGPFFAYSLTAKQYGYNYNSIITDSLVEESVEGERILIRGRIYDGQGNVIPDAVIELIQYFEADNQYVSSKIARQGTGTSEDGSFTFTTVKPKSINGQAPFLSVIVMMRGSLHHLHTRLYFSDENELNQQDSLLNSIPENRRNSLIANKLQKNNQVSYEFNIKMQGENETVFFKI
jgi:protocatechuate 3,4-dioxygenase, alpha subunit